MECANLDLFKQLTPVIGGKIDPVAERQELVTRFFVYVERYKEFTHDVRRFLDENMGLFNQHKSLTELRELRSVFKQTMGFIEKNYSKAFYRSNSPGRLPRVRFEAVAVGTALALQARPKLTFRNAGWLGSKRFEDLVKAEATNSAPNCVRGWNSYATAYSMQNDLGSALRRSGPI